MKLIDKDALMNAIGISAECEDCSRNIKLGCTGGSSFLFACKSITYAPTIDAVEVVRCKDCIWYEIYQLKKDGTDDRRYKPSYCASLGYQTRPDWFCGDGERREDADKE